MKIGFIGLGLMGGAIARHLAKSNDEFMVYDVLPQAVEKFKDITQTTVNIEQLFDFSEVVILSLPGSPEVNEIMDKFLTHGVKDKIIIDLSTSYPLSSKTLAERVAAGGGIFADASLTGNPERGERGEVQAIVGCDGKEVYEKLLPILELFTEKSFYAGGPGTGNLIKIATNYLAVLYINLYAEIFPLVEKNGGDLQVFYDVVSNSVADCGMFQRIAPKIMNDNYEVSFLMKHAIKDLKYLKELALEGNVATLVLDAGISEFLMGRAKGLENKDVSEVARVMKELILN